MTLNQTLTLVTLSTIITASVVEQAHAINQASRRGVTAAQAESFMKRMPSLSDTTERRHEAMAFADSLSRSGRAIVNDSTVYFFYMGTARRVSVPSDLNGWQPASDTMTRVGGTDLFVLVRHADPAARFDYKLWVDSTWILDPYNAQQSIGGFGPNSEVWMPRYVPPENVRYREGIAHGTLDTLQLRSTVLKRAHPVYVYRPPGYPKRGERYPSLYVMDGGEYLSLGLMNHILDNTIADGLIRPVVVVFVDPRTDPRDSRSNMRMTDYSMSDSFLRFLVSEVREQLLKKYRIDPRARETGIMGASLGGLIATYAVMQRPDIFGLCAAQSPAFQWQNNAIFGKITNPAGEGVRIYIDTGTIHDALDESRSMKTMLEEKGYSVRYAEHPEGHNWANWRARIGDILVYFWGKDR